MNRMNRMNRMNMKSFGRSALSALPRTAWIALALIHAPILLSVIVSIITDGADAARTSSALALAGTQTLFALKAIDVRWLRLRTRWQTLIVVTLITALVHGEAILSNDGPAMIPAIAPTTIIIGTLTAAGAARHRQWWLALGRQLRLAFVTVLFHGCRATVAALNVIAPAGAAAMACVGPRAPPAAA